MGPIDDEMAPGARGSVRGECLLGLSADVKYFRETFRLSLNSSLCPPTALLSDRVLRRVAALECDRLECARQACPSHLGLERDANDAGKVCLLQDLRACDRVLSADGEMGRRFRRHLRWKWLKCFHVMYMRSRFQSRRVRW